MGVLPEQLLTQVADALRRPAVAEVGGGAVDDPPGGQVANRRQLKHHCGVPGPIAAFWIGVEVVDELACPSW